jgi:hypothetical protein
MSTYRRIRINGDFNIWILTDQISLAKLAKADKPQSLGVAGPLTGTMLLSAKGAASITLLPSSDGTPSSGGPPIPTGWIPGEVAMLTPHLYLRSATPEVALHSLYPLPTRVDALELAGQIKDAMDKGTRSTVYFGANDRGPGVVLNGAELVFAVITQPTAS